MQQSNLKSRRIKQLISVGHLSKAMRLLGSSGLAPLNEATIQTLQARHPQSNADEDRRMHRLLLQPPPVEPPFH
jgi:hypothetical protein